MELILCSFVVLMSTSKLWNMNPNGHLVIEIAYDLYLISSFKQPLTSAPGVNFSQISPEFPTSGELFSIIIYPNPFNLFLCIESMFLLYGKIDKKSV